MPAPVQAVRYRVNINTLEKEAAAELGLNDIGAVVIETQKPLFCDPYRRNRATGSFILIDPMTNDTVAAGMITGREPGLGGSTTVASESAAVSGGRVTLLEQEGQAGHLAATVWLEAPPETAFELERMLFNEGRRVRAISASEGGFNLPDAARALNDAGVIVLVSGEGEPELRERTRERVTADRFLCVEATETEELRAGAVRRILEEHGLFAGL